MILDEESKSYGLRLLFALRNAGLKSDMDYLNRKVKAQMKAANRVKARFALIIGESEREMESVSVKCLETGEQEQIPFNQVVEHLQKGVH